MTSPCLDQQEDPRVQRQVGWSQTALRRETITRIISLDLEVGLGLGLTLNTEHILTLDQGDQQVVEDIWLILLPTIIPKDHLIYLIIDMDIVIDIVMDLHLLMITMAMQTMLAILIMVCLPIMTSKTPEITVHHAEILTLFLHPTSAILQPLITIDQ